MKVCECVCEGLCVCLYVCTRMAVGVEVVRCIRVKAGCSRVS